MSKVRYARIWADSLKVGDVFEHTNEGDYTGRTTTAWYEVTDIRELPKALADDAVYEVLATRSGGEYNAFIPDYIRETFAADDVLTIDRGK